MALRLTSAQRLASPDFGDVQRPLGMLVGSGQAVAKQKAKEQGMFSDLSKAIFSGDADQLLQASQQFVTTDPSLSMRLASQAQQMKTAQRTQEGQGALAYLQDQMRRALPDGVERHLYRRGSAKATEQSSGFGKRRCS